MRRAVQLLAVFCALGVAALVVARVDGDADLWGRLAFARDAGRAGTLLLTKDPYSYTAIGTPWFDHEWGFNWIAWAFFAPWGWAGIRALRVLLFAAAAALSLAPLLRSSRSALWGTAVAALWALAAYRGFFGPRAQSVGFVFFAWLVFCLERTRRGGLRWLFAGVLPLAAWVNVHGGFVAGLGVAGLWGSLALASAVRRRAWAEVKWIAAAGAFAALALAMTPLGFELSGFALRSSLYERPFIAEWDPLQPSSREFWLGALLALGAGLVLLRSRRWADLAVVAAIAAQAFLHARHLPFLAVAAVALAAPDAGEWLGALFRSGPPRLLRSALASACALGLLAVALAGEARALGEAAVRPAPREPLFPASAMAYVVERHAGQGGVVEFNWSMFALYAATPAGVSLAFDGRYTDVYPFDAYKRYFQWHYGLEGGDALLRDARARFVLVATGSDRDARMRALADWRPAHVDPLATVFDRLELPAGTLERR